MSQYRSVSDAARELGGRLGVAIRPRDITDLYYLRRLPTEQCPVVSGRRLIPEDHLPLIAQALRDRGRIAGIPGVTHHGDPARN
ncbi:hypothetical protein [Tautonia plasticadhaerens]|uniref:Uncharacterized protein n=1 Tax=Tautonia plasticadhaerens TaxID=2527974 RepID=A0A518H9F6_9BACT|nr:hypothetical protein [Tautonia plasticadhaerens]QDV37437.1 hypothetical protein ElP_53760 [Tautonia plasticadhaerens]